MKKLIVLVLSLCFTSSAWAVTEENKQILKDAIVGAVTGAVATEATKDEPKAPSAAPAPAASSGEERHKHKNFSHKKKHHHDGDEDEDHDHHHKKDKKRPHGWDMGKKTGWGGKDTPPGLAKKD